ncbi:MAG: hypothetical protein ACREOH_01925 [Candidatus Entotheonellia bacterium]
MQGDGRGASVALDTSSAVGRWDHPPRREAQGDGAAIGRSARERRVQGEGRPVSGDPNSQVREMRNAEPSVGLMHERGTHGLPRDDVSRQWDNPQVCLHAYGRISRKRGAMPPGVTGEPAEGRALATLESSIDARRHERYRWTPVRRGSIEKKALEEETTSRRSHLL